MRLLAEAACPQKRSRKDDQSIIRRHLRPAFGELKLAEVTVERVDQFVVDRGHLSPKTIHNILTLLIALLNLAVDLPWLLKAPRIRKPSIRPMEQDFRYLRSMEEVRRFLDAARAEGAVVFALYATAVYTGMRAGELAGLRWSDVDLDGRLITVQRSFEGPTKAGDVRYVPILKRWRLQCPGVLVFPNRDGGMQGESARIFQEVLHRVLDRAGFPTEENNGKTRRYIVFHDTRHTFASQWVMGGGNIFKLQKILGHKSISTTMRYAHLARSAFAEDYGLLGEGEPVTEGTVMQFRTKGRET